MGNSVSSLSITELFLCKFTLLIYSQCFPDQDIPCARSEQQQLKLLPLHNWRVQLAMIAINRGGPLLRYVIIVISDLQIAALLHWRLYVNGGFACFALLREPGDVVPTSLGAPAVVCRCSSGELAASRAEAGSTFLTLGRSSARLCFCSAVKRCARRPSSWRFSVFIISYKVGLAVVNVHRDAGVLSQPPYSRCAWLSSITFIIIVQPIYSLPPSIFLFYFIFEEPGRGSRKERSCSRLSGFRSFSISPWCWSCTLQREGGEKIPECIKIKHRPKHLTQPLPLPLPPLLPTSIMM